MYFEYYFHVADMGYMYIVSVFNQPIIYIYTGLHFRDQTYIFVELGGKV